VKAVRLVGEGLSWEGFVEIEWKRVEVMDDESGDGAAECR